MRKLILHIGRHKTGTTAIQKFLTENTEYLKSNGYFYPKTGIRGYGHHDIAEPLNRKRNFFNFFTKENKEQKTLIREIDSEPNLTPIVSSEAFQNSDPKLVRKLFKGFDVTVVVYLRNQVDYLASSYVQKVHATDYCGSIEEYYRFIYNADYSTFIKRWEANFPQKINVRRFDRVAMLNNDIIDDFIFSAINEKLNREEVKIKEDPNPSINSEVLKLKMHLNKQKITETLPANKLYKCLTDLNKLFPADNYKLDKKMASKVLKKYEHAENIIAQNYFGESTLFNYEKINSHKNQGSKEYPIEEMLKALENMLNTR